MSIQHLGATTSSDSLRNRKRAATRLSIRRAAIELGLEHGYEHVTVDMICSASKISPRTFFNYFGSKEGVYASPNRAMPSEQRRRTFVESNNSGVFDDLFTLIADSLVEVDSNLELFQARRQLIHETPELLHKEKSRISELEETYVDYVLERYRFQGRNNAKTPDLADEAHLVVALVSGAMRFAMQKWVAGNFSTTPEELVRNTSALVHRIASNEHWP